MNAVLSAWPRETAGAAIWRWVTAAIGPLAVLKLALSDGGRDLSALTAVQTAVLGLLVVLVASGRLGPDPVIRALACMAAVVGASALWSVRPEATVREALLWCTYLGIAAVLSWAVRTPRDAARAADLLLAAGIWLSLHALFVFWGNGTDPRIRWSSTFYWPNPFAAFLLAAIPLALGRCLRAATPREAAVYGAVAAMLGVALLFTGSRAGWLACLGGVAALLATLRPLPHRAAGRLLLVAVVAAASAAALARLGPPGSEGAVSTRLASIADPADPSVTGRLHFWTAALRIARDHPLGGTGAGTFGVVHPVYQRDPRYYARDPHNVVAQVLAELGLLGAAALALLLLALARTWRRALRAEAGASPSGLAAGAGAGLAAVLLHSGVDMNWSFPAVPAMASALAGLLSALARQAPPPGVEEGVPAVPPRRGRPRRALLWRTAATAVLLAALAAAQVGRVAHARYLEGSRLTRAGRWSEAADRFAEAARWNPLSPLYPRSEAAAAMQASPPDRGRAAAALRRAMAVDRMSAAHPQQLAAVLASGTAAPEETAEAERLLRLALRLDPMNRPDAYRELAALYRRQGRPDDARAVYQAAAERYAGRGLGRASVLRLFLWPAAAAVLVEAAEFHVAEGARDEAERLLTAIVSEDPTATTALLRLAALYVAAGRTGDARALLEQAARHLPDDERVRRALTDLPREP